MASPLRFRQVHLDFHTSEHIPDVGAEFDAEHFVATLRRASVDSVTLFSRCHHGWIYHDTKFPNRHPNLTRNLLAEQIRACHAADIRCPIYITVGWDEYAARTHPEWLELDETGRHCGPAPSPLQPGWRNLDFASEYIDYVIAQTEEVCDLFGDEVDGFFFDIIFQRGVHSEACLARFRKEGWDPTDATAQQRMRDLLVYECVSRIESAVRAKQSYGTVFFNGGHVGPAFRKMLAHYTHLEVESLPTGGWGYSHFPMTARYSRTLNPQFLGMTGKFSESWGHFNSYKPQAALDFECLSAVALGGRCSVGDQLPPGGRLDEMTYDLIGRTYARIAALEPWTESAVGFAEIAVVNAEQFNTSQARMDPRNVGATRMLLEGHHQFDLIDTEADYSHYRLLILPDVIELSDEQADKVDAYLVAGGCVITSGSSGRNLTHRAAEFTGESLPYSPDYLHSDWLLREDSAIVMYERGEEIRPRAGAEVLATVTEPYFNRSYARFVSHAHTPPAHRTDQPALVQRDRVITFAHPIFTTYAIHSMTHHRDLVLAAIRRLLPDPAVRSNGPRSLQILLTDLPDARRVVHLLHYVPERRGLHLDIVEDPMPVVGLNLDLAGSWSARSVPDGSPLAATLRDGRTAIEVPTFAGYQAIELSPATE
ncbi:MAG: alpha-amylase family protein [Fimbriimonadaceae bacterium]|nr:alpha-amylase family protein [Fimbriimonadaceae bacterium]